MRTRALATAWAVAVVISCLAPAPRVAAQERTDWLRRHTIPIRTEGRGHDDFSDLEKLVPLLKNVRILQLAELSHGDGAGSQVRVRLIRFLHDRLGFDVLVWEAGFLESERLNALLASDAPLEEIPGSALWWFWSSSSQILPLFTFARETWETTRPLRMAGFDLQFTGGIPGLIQRLTDVRDWFAVAGHPIPADLQATLDRASQRLLRSGGAGDAVRDTLLAHAAELLSHFEVNADAMRLTHGAAGASRIERVLRNMVEYRDMLSDRDKSYAGGPDATQAFVDSYNRRERVNADNLIWLADTGYQKAKLIVWSHNVHAAYTRFSPRYDSLVAPNTADGLESTGRLLRTRFGDVVYSVGTIAYEGEWGLPDDRSVTIRRPDRGSLEHLMNDLGQEYAILDLRAARTPGHWLLQPTRGSISAQVPHAYPIIWPTVFDGVLFVRRMTPARAVR